MKKRFTIKDLQTSACAHLNPHVFEKPQKKKKPAITIKQRSKEKEWLSWNLMYWCNENSLILEEEVKFHEERKWRFDWCIPALMVAIEYNGIMSEKSRHTSIKGYSGDLEKINAAQSLGWRVMQYSPLNYKKVLRDLEEIFKTKK